MRIEPEGAELPFSRRLASENGWSGRYAERVDAEYRRFLFLAATCDHPVTPSDEVDQAWHLHLAYTRSYWGELCEQILGRPLHHGPTAGGAIERKRYHDQYEQTLKAYKDAFDEEPPADIWPPVGTRFATKPVRIDMSRHLPVGKGSIVLAAMMLTSGMLSLALGDAVFAALVMSGGLAFSLIKLSWEGSLNLERQIPSTRSDDGGSSGGCGTDGGCGGGGCGGGCG